MTTHTSQASVQECRFESTTWVSIVLAIFSSHLHHNHQDNWTHWLGHQVLECRQQLQHSISTDSIKVNSYLSLLLLSFHNHLYLLINTRSLIFHRSHLLFFLHIPLNGRLLGLFFRNIFIATCNWRRTSGMWCIVLANNTGIGNRR